MPSNRMMKKHHKHITDDPNRSSFLFYPSTLDIGNDLAMVQAALNRIHIHDLTTFGGVSSLNASLASASSAADVRLDSFILHCDSLTGSSSYGNRWLARSFSSCAKRCTYHRHRANLGLHSG